MRGVNIKATVRRSREMKARRSFIPFGVLAKPRTTLLAAPPIEPLAPFIVGGTVELQPSRASMPGDLMRVPTPMVSSRFATPCESRRPFLKTRWIR